MRQRLAQVLLCISVIWIGMAASAQERQVVLAAPDTLVESGVLKFILPRFSLKNSIRVPLVAPGAPTAQVVLTDDPSAGGRAVFTGQGATWHLVVLTPGQGSAFVDRFQDWLRSDIGQSAVASFQIDGVAPFGPPEKVEVAIAAIEMDGDARTGERLSLSMCGRCHVVSDANRMNGIGSTPSFAVLRTFEDWEGRFSAFYALAPHPAFTQVEDVTPDFDPTRPSPIAPVEMTLEDLENILAYVASVPPADLGAPIQSQ